MLESAENSFVKFITDTYNENIFKYPQEALEILKINIFRDEGYQTLAEMVSNLHKDVVAPFAIYLIIIYFIIALVDKMSSENFTWEQFGRQMAMFFVSYGLILHGLEILDLMFEMGDLFLDKIAPTDFEGLEALDESVFEDFSSQFGLNIPFLKEAIAACYLMIPFALSWFVSMAGKILCYSRIIEIYIRALFAPIAFSDFFHTGFGGAGWNFLKSFAAVCIQGAMCVGILMIYCGLSKTIISGGGAAAAVIGKSLAFMAAACMLMFKTQSLAKELLGVR